MRNRGERQSGGGSGRSRSRSMSGTATNASGAAHGADRADALGRRFWPGPLAHVRLSETQRFLLLALFIGTFAGILVVLFHITIDLLSWSSLGALAGRFR